MSKEDSSLSHADVDYCNTYFVYAIICSQCEREVLREVPDPMRMCPAMFEAEGWARINDLVVCGNCRGIFPWSLERRADRVVLVGPSYLGCTNSYEHPFETMWQSGMPDLCVGDFIKLNLHRLDPLLAYEFFELALKDIHDAAKARQDSVEDAD